MPANQNGSSDSQTVALDNDARQLKLEQVKAEARQAIAEAQKAALVAQLPPSDVKPLEGKVDVGAGVGLVGQLVAYQLLGDAAATIVGVFRKGGVKQANVLVVEDRLLVGTDWAYVTVRRQLGFQKKAIDDMLTELTPPQPGQPSGGFTATLLPAAVAAPAVIGAAATLLGMFRTDYSITSRDVKIGTTPLIAAVANKLLDDDHQVSVDYFSLVADAAIARDFFGVQAKRNELAQKNLSLKISNVLPADRRIEDLRAEMKDVWSALDKALTGEAKGTAQTEELRKRLETLKSTLAETEIESAPDRAKNSRAEAVIAQFDAFATAVTTATGTGNPPLLMAALREGLHVPEDQSSTQARYSHVLFVGVEGGAAETITRRSLFRSSGQVGYMGGLQVSYLLHDVVQNRTVAGGTESLLAHLKYDLNHQKADHIVRVQLRTALDEGQREKEEENEALRQRRLNSRMGKGQLGQEQASADQAERVTESAKKR